MLATSAGHHLNGSATDFHVAGVVARFWKALALGTSRVVVDGGGCERCHCSDEPEIVISGVEEGPVAMAAERRRSGKESKSFRGKSR